MKNNFYKGRCEYLEKVNDCQNNLVNLSIEQINAKESIIKEQDSIIKCLEEYNNKLKNTVQELTMENDALKEKCMEKL